MIPSISTKRRLQHRKSIEKTSLLRMANIWKTQSPRMDIRSKKVSNEVCFKNNGKKKEKKDKTKKPKNKNKQTKNQAVAAHAFNPTLGRHRQVDLCEFLASLVCRANSRTAMAIPRNPALKQANKTK